MRAFWQSFDTWAHGRSWALRVPLLAFMGFLAYQMVTGEDHGCLAYGINLAIHEAGHLVFGFCGEFIAALGGTLLQCAVPVIACVLLLRIPDFFGIPFCGVWLASNLYNVSWYMADARAQEIPLVSTGSGDIQHDWNFILGSLNLLEWDTGLARLVAALAFVVAAGSLALCGYMILRMRRPATPVSGGRGRGFYYSDGSPPAG